MAVSTTLGDQASCLGSDESADMGFPGLIGIAARLELPLPHVSNVPMRAGRRFQPTSTYTPGLMSSAIVSPVASWITEMPARVPAACAGRIVDCRAGTAPAARGGGVR